MTNDVTASIIRKTDQGRAGAQHIVVRASSFTQDLAIAVSRLDYDQLQPGMLVRIFRAGWGPTRKWRLKP